MGYLPYQLVQDFFHQQYDPTTLEKDIFRIDAQSTLGPKQWVLMLAGIRPQLDGRRT